MSTVKYRGERGVALLVALFALLLLSAIGLAMMYSSTTETNVNTNFRDKQAAVYASMSAALEARERLQPATGDLVTWNGTPSTSAKNVIYITNPSYGETVAPWDYTNKYPDTELCQENILGLSGTYGTPCGGSSSLPTGSNWYNSVSAYGSSSTLPYKWTRISLKTNSMTPVSASSSASSTMQMCWDGKNQIPLPAGSGPACTPTGSVTSITLTATGNNYNNPPNVVIAAPPSGVRATATAQITVTGGGDKVVGASVTNPGSNYSSIPLVTLSGGGGTGAVIVATISPPGAPVASVNLSSAGTGCYLTAPNVSFSSSGATTAASATATLETTPSCIYSWSATGSCNAYKHDTTPKNVGAVGGSGFVGTITFKNGTGNVDTVAVTNPGTGYSSNPTGITGLASGCTPTIQSWVLGYHIASVTLNTGGAGYLSTPTVNIQAPNSGTTPTATATLGSQPANAGQVTGLTVTNPGAAYTSAPLLAFSGGGSGTGAAGLASLGSTGQVTGITITNGGSGYTSAPAVSFNGGGGSGAVAKAAVSSGTYYGQVFLVTSFAQTASGSKAMTQMEVATPVRSFAPAAALTLVGQNPTYTPTSSSNFYVDGHDSNTCGETAASTKPAIGVFDDPNHPTDPSSQTIVLDALNSGGAKPENYTGSKPAPDIENVFGALGDSMTTVTGMEALANQIAGMSGANYYPVGSTGSVNLGTAATPVVDVVDGDLTLSGNDSGYGILLVRGNLTMSGNFSWHGPIFIIGQGSFTAANGGGNGQIVGNLWIAKTRDSSGALLTSLGSPTANFNGGGGNYIQYDHCWADNFYAKINFVPPPGTAPLKILSTRTVTY